ncbi:DNA-directed RNA polymerase II subunit rpb1, partial [Ascosphaera atra]
MASANFTPSKAPLRTIKEIQFGLLSPEEIKRISVALIEYPETMVRMNNDKGPGKKVSTIPGLVLSTGTGGVPPARKASMIVPGISDILSFLTKIKKLLETVCHNCGKIKANTSDSKYLDALRFRDPKRRFDAIWRLSKDVLVCEADPTPDDDDPFEKAPKPVQGHGGCGNIQPQIRREGLTLVGSWKPNKMRDMLDDMDVQQPEKRVISPKMALNIFRNISAEDVRLMGLSNDYARPEWMIITALPVPPPPVRPSVLVGGS